MPSSSAVRFMFPWRLAIWRARYIRSTPDPGFVEGLGVHEVLGGRPLAIREVGAHVARADRVVLDQEIERLDRVAQLPCVAAPRPRPQQLLGLGVEAFLWLSRPQRRIQQKLARQREDVLGALAQRWDREDDYAEAEIQVFAEAPRHRVGAEVALRGGHNPRVAAAWRAAERGPLARLDHAENLGLRLERQLADFVEEERAADGAPEARRARARPRVRPVAWPKSSSSSSVGAIAPQCNTSKGPPRRADAAWIRRASSSFPVPLSPQIRTRSSLRATRSARSANSRAAVLSAIHWISRSSASRSARFSASSARRRIALRATTVVRLASSGFSRNPRPRASAPRRLFECRRAPRS